ncbi:MAG: periplasmic-type flagellar collar protein FlbB [Treponemataceae bacterium]
MSIKAAIGKTIILLILVFVFIFIGLFWFDFLGVIQIKQIFAPVYEMLGFQPQTSLTATSSSPYEADLESDRLAKRLESLNLRTQELNKRESDIKQLEVQNLQIAQELEDRVAAQEEREYSFDSTMKKYEDRDANIAQNAKNLNAMPPQSAVNILLGMEDQDVIDILRKVEQIAQETNTSSLVAYWMSLMPADRAAILQRKMANVSIIE